MKFTYLLVAACLFAISAVEASPKSKSLSKIKITSAPEKLKGEFEDLIEDLPTGDIRDIKKSIKKSKGSKKKLTKSEKKASKKKAKVVYAGTTRNNKKKWSVFTLKKAKKNYAAVIAETKCAKDKKVKGEAIKEALEKSLDQGKYMKVECGGGISEFKKGSKKDKKVAKTDKKKNKKNKKDKKDKKNKKDNKDKKNKKDNKKDKKKEEKEEKEE